MATTAPALLHNMHHFRSSSDTHPHNKLHKHRSFSHITFTETGKTEELRDDLSSQSSNNDAKSDLSRKGSVKRTVKKVKKYLSRRFSGHHPHHETNYSIASGGLVGAQFAYAALGMPASTPSSPSGGHSDRDHFIPLEQEHVDVAPIPDDGLDNSSPDALTDGVSTALQPNEGATDTDIQTRDNTSEFQDSNPFDQSFDSIDSRISAPHDDGSFELPDINIPVPNMPPASPMPNVLAESVVQEIQTQTEEGEEGEGEGLFNDAHGSPEQEEEIAVEPPESVTEGSMTILDSVESLRSLNDSIPSNAEVESKVESIETLTNINGTTAFAFALEQGNSSTSSSPETADIAETKGSPELSHAADTSTADVVDAVCSSESSDILQAADADLYKEATQTKPDVQSPTPAYVPYDDGLDDSSFDIFNVSYFKATVVALAASGLGVMLANGVYRLFRTQ